MALRNPIHLVEFEPSAKKIHAGDLNTMRDICQWVADGIPQVGLPGAEEVWQALIVLTGPNSEADYTDERYWVRCARCTRPSAEYPGNNDSQLVFDFMSTNHSQYRAVTATNLTELPLHSHMLKENDLVTVSTLRDHQGLQHYYFTSYKLPPGTHDGDLLIWNDTTKAWEILPWEDSAYKVLSIDAVNGTDKWDWVRLKGDVAP
jgi:hypothetical protein